MGDLPNRKQGWDLVEYEREWGPGVARLMYEHPRHGTQVVVRSLRTGNVHELTDRNPRPEPPNTRADAFRSWR